MKTHSVASVVSMFVVTSSLLTVALDTNLRRSLRHFETLHKDAISHSIVKRGVDPTRSG